MRVTVRIHVHGRVQGVSFRAALQQKAVDHGVVGWVRNSGDGSVEALLQGEKESVRLVTEWARTGPPRASVASFFEDRVDDHPALEGFSVLA